VLSGSPVLFIAGLMLLVTAGALYELLPERQTRAEPAGSAGSEASREGMGTLSGFPSTVSTAGDGERAKPSQPPQQAAER
jgi:hypothetical protein